jgi:hypothetical protein
MSEPTQATTDLRLKRVMANRITARSPISLRRHEVERLQENGLHEPYESRGSCTDLWGTGGETPPVYPAMNLNFSQYRSAL